MPESKKTETRTVYSLSSNSRTGEVKRGSTDVKVASGTPENSVKRRYENKPAGNWSNAQFGSKFSKGDIGRLQDKGFNQNQVMKIAQMAYASGNVKKVNKTNQALTDLGNQYLNQGIPSMTVKGQTMYGSPYGMDRINNPKKVFGWNGFGAPMSINKYNGAGYNQTSSYNLPSKYSAASIASQAPAAAATTTTNTPGSSSPTELTPTPTTPAVEEPMADPTTEVGMLSGGGAGINSATGLKRKGSSWKNQGKTSKGTSNLNRSLMVSAFNTK